MTEGKAIEILKNWGDLVWAQENNITNGDCDDAISIAIKAIKGISGNKEEIPPKYDAEYLQSKIDAHTKRMEEQGLTSEQMLEECRGGEYLTWQDVRKIVTIADDMVDERAYKKGTEPWLNSPEDYYTEVLKRFKEEKQ